jgi:membrane associated rhomboid family serine protease
MYSPSDSLFSRGMMTPVTRYLLISTIVLFFVQSLGDIFTSGSFTVIFALSWAGIKHMALWQLITYIFLHGNFFHLLLNMLGLFFFGPDTERAVGSKRFFILYFATGVLGGLGWLLLSARQAPAFCIGASGAIFGVLGAFSALFPSRPITLLLFFVIPVTMQARTLAIAMAVFSLLAAMGQPGNIAYAAHLAGGLAGYAYILAFNPAGRRFTMPSIRQMFNDLSWHWYRRKFKVMSGHENRAEGGQEPPTKKEVDEVLEKLSKSGMNSLTRRELDILKRASHTWENKEGRSWRK